jgi:hypothetical protein
VNIVLTRCSFSPRRCKTILPSSAQTCRVCFGVVSQVASVVQSLQTPVVQSLQTPNLTDVFMFLANKVAISVALSVDLFIPMRFHQVMRYPLKDQPKWEIQKVTKMSLPEYIHQISTTKTRYCRWYDCCQDHTKYVYYCDHCEGEDQRSEDGFFWCDRHLSDHDSIRCDRCDTVVCRQYHPCKSDLARR